ncbi:PIN domain-containing protein [Candidatus Woesearchaeota archaeon]|nr:PIN domain-containing protein [Candidatus Woesearchaeota archaeon]
MFADTDFLLALIKKSDWLKQNALIVSEKHKGHIRASMSVLIELALLCVRMKRPLLSTFANILEFAEVDEATYSICLTAGAYVDKNNVNVFDAFHAAYCGNDIIISSDAAYDKLGLERIKLEKVPS